MPQSLKSSQTEQLREATSRHFVPVELMLLNFCPLGRAQNKSVAALALSHLRLRRQFPVSQAVEYRLAALALVKVEATWRKYVAPDLLATAWGGDFMRAPRWRRGMGSFGAMVGTVGCIRPYQGSRPEGPGGWPKSCLKRARSAMLTTPLPSRSNSALVLPNEALNAAKSAMLTLPLLSKSASQALP